MGQIIVEGVRVSTDHYIGGERVSSNRTFEDISPIDETTLGYVAAGGSKEIEAAVETTDNGSLLEASRLPVMKRSGNNIRFFANYPEQLQSEVWDVAGGNAQNRVLGIEAGAALVSHPEVRRIAFTGSPATARYIGKAAAENITLVSFELGG